jgi:nucleoside-diphosphate-sugar epimerase
MRLLVLGGTAWLGSTIAAIAIERGDQVTCLARGASGEAPPGVTFVRADRDEPGAYERVSGEDWDAVVDVSRQPGQVRRAVAALAERSGMFVFVSTGNVYADHSKPGQDETAALLPALDGDVMTSMETYGAAKVACEQHVLDGFGPARSLIARVGLIGTTYWPLRFARPAAEDGSVLVPDAPELPTQLIDVRDLAGWIVAAADRGVSGIFNAMGETLPLALHLAAASAVAGHTGPVVAVSEDWLVEQGVEPWMGERSLPLWLADPDYAGFNARDSAAARAAGLVTRPLEESLADALAWELTRDPSQPRGAGLADADERALLHAWARRAQL